jgi:signal transduction histidine kinase
MIREALQPVFRLAERILWLLPLLLAIATAHGQIEHAHPDTNQIKKYLNRSKDIFETKHDSSYYYLSEALAGSYNAHYSKGIVSSLTELAAWHYGGNADMAIKYGNMAMYEFVSRGLPNYQNVRYRIYNILAKSYEAKGMIDSSAYYFYLMNDAIEAGKIPVKSYFALSLYTQLAMFWVNANWDINTSNIEPAQYFINKAKIADSAMADSATDLSNVSYALQGAYYSALKNYDSARYYQIAYMKLRQQSKVINITWDAATYLNIAESYLFQNKPAEAMPYIEKALALKKALGGNTRFLVIANFLLAKAYFQQQQYAKSIATFEHTWDTYDRNEFLDMEVMDAYNIAADSYKAVGKLSEALNYKNTYIRLHDSLMKKDKLDMMNHLQIRYRISEKDKALAEQQLATSEAENKVRRKNLWIALISFIAVLGCILFTVWRRNSLHKQHLQQEKINNFQQQMEIENLNAAIAGEERERTRIARELHDGIGGLMAASKMNFELVKKAYSLDNENNFKDGLLLLEEASAELRKTAHNMMPEILLQDGLAVAVAYFCHKVGNNSATNVHFQTLGVIRPFNPQFELAVYRIIQELVHNILKHAKATEAIVQMGFNDTIFDVTVEDNGIGMPPDMMEHSKGIGLKSVAERVKTIDGHLEIQNLEGGGTSIYFEVSLKKENFAGV